MAIRTSKEYNPYDDLVSFVMSNRISGKQEQRLREIIDKIIEFKAKKQTQ